MELPKKQIFKGSSSGLVLHSTVNGRNGMACMVVNSLDIYLPKQYTKVNSQAIWPDLDNGYSIITHKENNLLS